MSGVRVRFAPSPTGRLHIGVARTALYNWLLARHEGGAFILRIEDTDRARSRQEYLDAIVEDLRWLGLDWDEGPEVGGPKGPYFQSQRSDSYAPHLERLLREGHAYRCFCSPEELEQRRRAHPAGPDAWRYDRRCLSLSPEEATRLAAERPAVLRFRVPDGTTSFDDAILGAIEVDNGELDDLVIARADGTPTYNFAVVVDDLEMGITHVVRGSDHLSNTPRQVLLWRALGHEPPTFGHLPLVLSQDGQVLSKRRGAMAVGEYRRRGYLPEALVNYMALLGWAYDGEQEFFAAEELIRKFEIGRVGKKPTSFDPEKLAWMNAQWIKRLDVSERTDRLVPILWSEGLLDAEPTGEHRRWLESVVALIDDRLKTLRDILDFDWFFLASDVDYDSMAVSKVLAKPGAGGILAGLRQTLSGAPDFEPDTLERLIRAYAEEAGLKLGKAIQPVRVAVTGKSASPGIFETLSLLGRDRVLARIEAAGHLIS
jgi:nondiscriminating glutamyl-tRNA synthetase